MIVQTCGSRARAPALFLCPGGTGAEADMPTHGRNRPDHQGPQRSAYAINRKIILATQTICAICGQPVDKTLKSPDPMSATVDHIIPVTRHGHPSDLANLQLAHRACNLAKGTTLPSQAQQEHAVKKIQGPALSHDWKSF